jgi:hypothetical protein
MELFGILLSAPFLFVISIVYAVLIRKVTDRWVILTKPILWMSSGIMVLFAIEAIAVVSAGTIEVRKAVGSLYYPVHLLLFFLTVPSIVNVMRLQRRIALVSKWYVIAPVCALLGLGIVLFQYVVSEALFGIDGMSGPYS